MVHQCTRGGGNWIHLNCGPKPLHIDAKCLGIVSVSRGMSRAIALGMETLTIVGQVIFVLGSIGAIIGMVIVAIDEGAAGGEQ